MWFRARSSRGADHRSGSALVIVLMGMMLLSALGLATVLLATADSLAASNQRDSRAALYSAESGIERAAAELVGSTDWDSILSGAHVSVFADGPPSGTRALPGGGTVGPALVANIANCGSAAGCSAAARQAVTADRPWGANNPFWQPYWYGLVNQGSASGAFYVVVLVADDPAETDGNPERDEVSPGNPGAGTLLLRAEVIGPRGARRSVEAIMARVALGAGPAALRFVSWRDVR